MIADFFLVIGIGCLLALAGIGLWIYIDLHSDGSIAALRAEFRAAIIKAFRP